MNAAMNDCLPRLASCILPSVCRRNHDFKAFDPGRHLIKFADNLEPINYFGAVSALAKNQELFLIRHAEYAEGLAIGEIDQSSQALCTALMQAYIVMYAQVSINACRARWTGRK